jgi:hypothetical protein
VARSGPISCSKSTSPQPAKQAGARRPELLLTGPALTGQARLVTVILPAGWSPEQLRHIITDRTLPNQVRTSIGAVIAARLRPAHG